MQIIRVLIPKISLFPLDYKSEHTHIVGDLIVVPFRNKQITGIVWEINCVNTGKKLKSISNENLFAASINSKIISLISRAAQYYLTELGTVAKLVLPVDINETPIKIHQQELNSEIKLAHLSLHQEQALEEINNNIKPTLIKGVTGSGKTEIYFYAILDQ